MGEGTGVLVIGGGPAGLAAAIAARMKGFDVTVVDGATPPIDKACGEGLMPGSLADLQELGVAIGPGDGRVFPGIRFMDATTSVEASFSGAGGFGCRRTILHQKMVERAQECGITLLWNTPVAGLSRDGAIVGDTVMKAKWIIGTDRVEVHWGQKAQAYVTPLGNDETCVALISRDPRMRLEDASREFPRLAGYMRHAEPCSAERGGVTVTRGLNQVYNGNVALIGDASGSVDAITGEGLRLSFLQAKALADALGSGNLRNYQRAHRRLSRRPNTMGRLLLLLDRYPRLRKRAFRCLAQKPELFAQLLAAHVGESSPKFLAATSLRFGWQFLTV